eukprot:c52307_g1_i1.p1 GENE.c52307_g1_i1~~c52307_g1_i1.p1  ORF type:complete len:423 (+),score=71.86 c52307_g1_i1:47-1315(+)
MGNKCCGSGRSADGLVISMAPNPLQTRLNTSDILITRTVSKSLKPAIPAIQNPVRVSKTALFLYAATEAAHLLRAAPRSLPKPTQPSKVGPTPATERPEPIPSKIPTLIVEEPSAPQQASQTPQERKSSDSSTSSSTVPPTSWPMVIRGKLEPIAIAEEDSAQPPPSWPVMQRGKLQNMVLHLELSSSEEDEPATHARQPEPEAPTHQIQNEPTHMIRGKTDQSESSVSTNERAQGSDRMKPTKFGDEDDSDNEAPPNWPKKRNHNEQKPKRKEGFLTKHRVIKGNWETKPLSNNWKRRYFKIESLHLSYFKSPIDDVPRGIFHLDEGSTVGSGEKSFKKHCIAIYSPKSDASLLAYAASEAEAKEWMEAIREVIRLCLTRVDVVTVEPRPSLLHRLSITRRTRSRTGSARSETIPELLEDT